MITTLYALNADSRYVTGKLLGIMTLLAYYETHGVR